MSETHTLQIGNNTTTITTPDGFGDLAVEAFVAQYGYQEQIPNPESETGELMANPQSKAEFASLQIVGFVRQVVAAHVKKQAVAQAAAAAETQSDSMGSQLQVSVASS